LVFFICLFLFFRKGYPVNQSIFAYDKNLLKRQVIHGMDKRCENSRWLGLINAKRALPFIPRLKRRMFSHEVTVAFTKKEIVNIFIFNRKKDSGFD